MPNTETRLLASSQPNISFSLVAVTFKLQESLTIRWFVKISNCVNSGAYFLQSSKHRTGFCRGNSLPTESHRRWCVSTLRTSLSVRLFVPASNISVTVGWIGGKFGADINAPVRMNCSNPDYKPTTVWSPSAVHRVQWTLYLLNICVLAWWR